MSLPADDIARLLEAELAKFSSPTTSAGQTDAMSSAAITAAAERDASATQAATARALLELDGVHEELIRQYMHVSRFDIQG